MDFTTKIYLPLYLNNISAGFPSPADEYVSKTLDLNDYLIRNPAATFFMKVDCDAMKNDGIFTRDILVVDRSLALSNGNLIICSIDGELLLRRYYRKKSHLILSASNELIQDIILEKDSELNLWGVVKSVIRVL